jgi:hypothetical protein
VSITERIFGDLGPEYQNGDEVLRPILTALEPTLNTAENGLTTLADLFDPENVPDSGLDWALWLNGWPTAPGSESLKITPYAKRQVLKQIPVWRKTWGQDGVFEEIFATYTKTSSTETGITITIAPRVSTPGGFRMGAGRMGRGRMWQLWTNNSILIKITDLGTWIDPGDFDDPELDFLEGLLDLLLPPNYDFELRQAF